MLPLRAAAEIADAIVWKDNIVEGMNCEPGVIEKNCYICKANRASDTDTLITHSLVIKWALKKHSLGGNSIKCLFEERNGKAKSSIRKSLYTSLWITHLTWLLIDVLNMNPKIKLKRMRSLKADWRWPAMWTLLAVADGEAANKWLRFIWDELSEVTGIGENNED